MTRQVSTREYLLSLTLSDAFSPLNPTTFQLGQGVPPFNEIIKGLYLIAENEISGPPPGDNNLTNVSAAQLQSFFFSFANFEGNLFVEMLPARALIIAPSDTKKGQYYDIGQRIDFSKSFITISQGLAAPPANTSYCLNLMIVT